MTDWQMVGIAWCLVGVMFLLTTAVGEHRRRARARWIERLAADAAEDAEDRELGEALARLRHPSSGPAGRMWR